MASRNPTRPVGAPRSLDPQRIGNEGPRFGVPGSETLTGYASLVMATLSGIELRCPNTGYPGGPGTRPSYNPATASVTVIAPPAGKKFRVTLRVRGVMERCGITSPNTTLSAFVVEGGGRIALNALYLLLSFTGKSYALNYKAGATSDPIESLDHTFTIDLLAAETVVGVNMLGVSNSRQRDNTVEQVVGPVGLSPYPSYYSGQFSRIDCTACEVIDA